MAFSKNSMAWGFSPLWRSLGTMAMQEARSSKGTTRLTAAFGAGMSLSVSSVMMPSVPSEPIIRCRRL